MPLTPEQPARREIDAQLAAAGWVVQEKRRLNLHAAQGIALCETDVEGGFADYMSFVDGKSIGILEAKAATVSLVGVSEQSEIYARANLTDFQRWADSLPFPELARQRFANWLTQQETAAGKPFTAEQRAFLTLIAEEIGANAALETRDLDRGTLKSRGGLPRALALFGNDRLPTLLEDLNTALAA